MDEVARHMAAPGSGLDIRDRMWLKIKIPKSFIGKLCLRYLWHTAGLRNYQCLAKCFARLTELVVGLDCSMSVLGTQSYVGLEISCFLCFLEFSYM